MKKYSLALIPLILELMRIAVGEFKFYVATGSWLLSYENYEIIQFVCNVLIQTAIILIILKFINIQGKKGFYIGLTFILYLCALYRMTLYNTIIMTMLTKPTIVSHFKINMDIIELVPFKNIVQAFNSPTYFIQVFGNLLLLSPLAFFIKYYNSNLGVKKVMIMIVLITLGIEISQLIQGSLLSMYKHMTILKIFDIDDIILNISGGAIGILIYNLYIKFKNTYQDTVIYKYTYNTYICITLIASYHYFNNLYYVI